MRKPTILVADDEPRVRELVGDFLLNAGCDVLFAGNGSEAWTMYSKLDKSIDLLILDVMMPYMDGWEVLKKVKQVSSVPVIMLTAKSEEADQLAGFRLGANDYVNKPFSPSVLVARVLNLLHASGKRNNGTRTIGGIYIQEIEHSVSIDGMMIDLTPKEYDLLLFFAKNPGAALSRDKILNAVWSYDFFGGLRTVDTHVKQLRAKLGEYSSMIETVRGIGYRMRELK